MYSTVKSQWNAEKADLHTLHSRGKQDLFGGCFVLFVWLFFCLFVFLFVCFFCFVVVVFFLGGGGGGDPFKYIMDNLIFIVFYLYGKIHPNTKG